MSSIAHHPAATRRIAVVVGVLLLAGILAGSDSIRTWLLDLIALAEPWITRRPVLGAMAFVGLAALSAMVVFFSSVLLVPLGVEVWGVTGCVLLLWTGWLLGALVTYTIGRRFGRRMVERLVPPAKLASYESHIPESRSFWAAFGVQLALQSDIAGYLLGLLAFPLPTYLAAVMVAELIFAVATVSLGAAFVRGQGLFLLAGAVVAAAVLLWRHFRARGRRA